MQRVIDAETKMARHQTLARVFTPNAPVRRVELFRGRLPQIFQTSNALNQPGQHVVLYGERGVGKTSLATLLTQLLGVLGSLARHTVRINCTTQDTFLSIWTKVFREMHIPAPAEWQERRPDPDDVRWALSELEHPRVIVLDEFDRVEDDDSLSLMADTVKSLSDHLVETKLVIVGVADSIDQLIGEHESVQRAFEEVNMPRMSEDEVIEVVEKGLLEAEMKVAPAARTRIVKLCEGLPHYAHYLSLHAGQFALMDDRDAVSVADVQVAVKQAAEKHSLLREYQLAIRSSRADTLYSRVLAACALAEKDQLGYFTAGAVREPMSRIMGRHYGIPAFAPHLDAFTSMDRGSVLRKDGPPRRYRYRFRNPLLQPFSIFAALNAGELPEDYERDIFGNGTAGVPT